MASEAYKASSDFNKTVPLGRQNRKAIRDLLNSGVPPSIIIAQPISLHMAH